MAVIHSSGRVSLSTYLVYLNTAQKIDTVEHGMVRGLAIANPVTCETRSLARDFIAIEVGDEIIGCNGDGIRWKANIDEIVEATSQDEAQEAIQAAGNSPPSPMARAVAIPETISDIRPESRNPNSSGA